MSYHPDSYDSRAYRLWHLKLRQTRREHQLPFVLRINGKAYCWTSQDPYGVSHRLGEAERQREASYYLLCLDDGQFHHISTIPEGEIEVVELAT